MDTPLSLLKKRPQDSHKGTFGTVKLLCGSSSYTGAAALCCEGALRSGCGIVKLFADESVCLPVRIRCPEVINCTPSMFSETDAAGAVIGCGISDVHNIILPEIFKNLNCPAVVDADGINFLAANKDVLRDAKLNAVFTPHPGEFGRLLNMDTDKINSDRVNLAVNFSRYHGCTLVLKGKNTVVATKGEQVYINDTGCSALAKGGSGDVLAGVIGALLAQGYDNHSAAVIGVYVHGKASEILSERYGESGVLPSDLPKMIGKLLG